MARWQDASSLRALAKQSWLRVKRLPRSFSLPRNDNNSKPKVAPICYLLFAICLLLVTSHWSLVTDALAVSQHINLQGKITNTDGTNVTDGLYDFEFKLYDGAGSGATNTFTESWTNASLWTSTMSVAPSSSGTSLTYNSNSNESSIKAGQILWNTTKEEAVKVVAVNTGTNVVTISATARSWNTTDIVTNRIYVQDGIFQVALNSLNQNWGTTDFSTDNLHVGINFNTDGEMKPRSPFNSVAYAFRAESAKSVDGLSAATGKTLTVNNSITFGGTDSTSFTLPSSSDTIVGINAAQTLLNKTLSNAVLSGSLTISSLTTNGGLLYTNGSGVVAQTAAGTLGQCLQSNGGGTPTWGACGTTIVADSLNFTDFADSLVLDVSTDIALGALTLSTSGTGEVNFNHTGETTFTGNVGIGTSGSGYKLDIHNAGPGVLRAMSTGANSAAFTLETEQVGQSAYFEFTENSDLKFQLGKAPTNYFYLYDDDNGADRIRVETDGTVNFSPAGVGNVAVGKYTASAKLDVEGTFRAAGAVTLANYTTDGGLLYTNTSGVVAQTTTGTLGQCLQSAGGGSPTWGSCGGSIAADSLDFTEFADALTLDAATSIALGSNTLSTTGTGGITFGHTGATTYAGTVTSSGLLTASNGFTLSSGALSLPSNSVTDAMASNTLTSSIFIGSGSTTNAVDLGTAEVSGALAAANITADSLDFTEFADTLTLDVPTTIALGANTLTVGGTAGIAFGHTGDTTFAGNVGIGTTSPSELLHIKKADSDVAMIYETTGQSGVATGDTLAGTGADNAGVGTITWTNPGNVTASDNTYAEAALTTSGISHYLYATNFGFSLPSNATVTGITAKVERTIPGSGTHLVSDHTISLIKAGTVVGDNKADTETGWSTETTIAYGGSSDMWGTTWSYSEINAANFGLAIAIANPGVSSGTGRVDSVTLSVSYSVPGSPAYWVSGVDYSNDAAFQISQSTSFGTNDYLTISRDGNIGIGTTSPAQTLDVAGTLNVSGAVTLGGVVTLSNYTNQGGVLYTYGAPGQLAQVSPSAGNQCLKSVADAPPVWGSCGISGSGAVGQLAFFDGSSSQTSDSNLVWDNVNKRLGIGTASPSGNIHVASSAADASVVYQTSSGAINTGATSAGTGADNSSIGNIAWTNPGNITASDDSRATATLLPFESTHYLTATNFGFSIPSGATIAGIIVDVERQSDGSAVDNSVKIIKGGVISGDENKLAGDWPDGFPGDSYATYGGATDLWGLPWSDSDINAGNFGVAISANNPSSSSEDVLVDHIRITICYSTAAGNATWLTGIDYSDSGSFKIANSAALGTNDYLTISGDGNVGIGVADPDRLLHVQADQAEGVATIERLTTATAGANGALRIKSTTSGDMASTFGTAISFLVEDSAGVENTIGLITAQRAGQDNSGNISLVTYNNGSVGGNLSLFATGEVGIGTESPLRKVHIETTAGASIQNDALLLRNNNTSTDAYVGLAFSHYNTSNDSQTKAAIGLVKTSTFSRGDLVFSIDNAADSNNVDFTTDEVMRITKTGELAIGTKSATGKLTISALVDGGSAGASNQHIALRYEANTNGVGPGISFATSADTSQIGAKIVFDRTNGNSQGDLVFYTKSDTSSGDTTTEKLRIHDDGSVTIGVGGNVITFSSTGITLTGSTRKARTISLQPEYSGGVLSAFYGAGTDTSITGSMTSDIETTTANEQRTYYNWTSSQTSLNYYTVAVRVKLPKDFSAWADTNALQYDIVTTTTSSADNIIEVRAYRENNSTAIFSAASASTTGTTWRTVSIDDANLTSGTAWNNADETAILYFRLGAKSDNYARIGEIKLNYLSKF